jgi:hypothetical protein
MEPEGSLPRSQEPFIGPYPKPDQSESILKVLTMVYKTQNCWVFGLCPSSGNLEIFIPYFPVISFRISLVSGD